MTTAFLPPGHFLVTGASGVPQVQQVTDPDNAPSPQDDELPEGVAFPLGDSFGHQYVTSPGGIQERTGARDLSSSQARMMGHADAMEGRQPSHKEEYGASRQKHGRYLQGWNETAGLIHGLVGRAPMSADEYARHTGRPDLHSHYLSSYAEGRKMNVEPSSLYQTASRTADSWSQPRETVSDVYPVASSPQTNPPMTQPSGDYAAGQQAGQADAAAGQRPAFADSSSGVSPYVKGYAEGYTSRPPQARQQDVPYSMGGDSGQAANAQQAQQQAQVNRTVQDGGSGGGPVTARRRVSAAFAPEALMADGDFRKGYLFASKWRPGQHLPGHGPATFEAGLYAGVTDSPAAQAGWLAAHAAGAAGHPELSRRIALHASFTRRHAAKTGMRVQGAYVRQAGTSTDLITDGPGTSPDPLGSTPLNGPGTPPPMGGRADAATPGGAPPYQGAPPLPGGPVVPDDVMGKPQQPAQPSGPFTNTFSGDHQENATLAPVAPNSADEPGYSNPAAYQGDPHAGARQAAFRQRVQAALVKTGAR